MQQITQQNTHLSIPCQPHSLSQLSENIDDRIISEIAEIEAAITDCDFRLIHESRVYDEFFKFQKKAAAWKHKNRMINDRDYEEIKQSIALQEQERLQVLDSWIKSKALFIKLREQYQQQIVGVCQ